MGFRITLAYSGIVFDYLIEILSAHLV